MIRAGLVGVAVLFFIIGAFAQSATGKPLTFKITVMSDGMDGDATEAGFQSPHWSHAHFGRNGYEASDRQKLTATYLELRNEYEAKLYFEWSLKRTIKVTRTGDKRDKKGTIVGLRAEAVPKSRTSGCAVMWTDASTFREIVADDCTHARALEKQYTVK